LTRDELYEVPSESPGIWRYRRALPISEETNPTSLGEGQTPLIRSQNLAKEMRLEMLLIKNEGQNPTGSFKDRGMTVAVTRALESAAEILVCASTGNTAASLAAYAARAGIRAVVVLPAGNVSWGKLSQAIAHGARLIKIHGPFDKALDYTRKLIATVKKLYLVNSINPYRIEGQKTVAFEILEQLSFNVPDYVALPVGNAGNISAVWKGFHELSSSGIIKKLPKLIGVQAAGAAPIADAFARDLDLVEPWKEPETVATAIKIGNPVSWMKALRALRESKGLALSVQDKEIVRARSELASKEGLFVENASASPLAAIKKLRHRIKKDDSIVCIATGHGLKDQDTIRLSRGQVKTATNESSFISLLRG
jgi:threonine synthase